MSDENLRQLERRAEEAPDDGAALDTLDRAQARAGVPRLRETLLSRLAGAVERRRADLEMVLRYRRALMFTAIYGRTYGLRAMSEVTHAPEIVRHRSFTGRMTSRDPNILPPLTEADAAAPPPATLPQAEEMVAAWSRQYRVVGEFHERVRRIAARVDYAAIERRAWNAINGRGPESIMGMRTPEGDSVARVLHHEIEMQRPAPRYNSWMEEVEDLERQHGRVFEEQERRAMAADRAMRLDWPEPVPAPPDLPPAEPTPQERARERTRANVRRRPPRRLP